MVEHIHSTLEPAEVVNQLRSVVSSAPRPASWELLPQQPDGVFYGKITDDHFEFSPASVHEKGSPILEIKGAISLASPSDTIKSHIVLRYRPGSQKLIIWLSMLVLFICWILVALQHARKTGQVSAATILPVFGLCALAGFMRMYHHKLTAAQHIIRELLSAH
jgi:hypothetical protein